MNAASIIAESGELQLGNDEIHLWILPQGDSALAQRLLARYLACDGAELIVAKTPSGKPYLPDQRLRFSLSHHKNKAILALAHDLELGIDLEGPRALKRKPQLLQRCFTDAEADYLVARPDSDLLRFWVAKEAIAKAIGRGIAYGLKNIGLTTHADQGLQLIALGAEEGAAQDWQLHELALWPNHHAALAYRGHKRFIVISRYDAQLKPFFAI